MFIPNGEAVTGIMLIILGIFWLLSRRADAHKTDLL